MVRFIFMVRARCITNIVIGFQEIAQETQTLCVFDRLPVVSSQETHTLCVFDRLPVVSWRRAKYKQMYGLKSTLTVSR